MLRAGNFAQIDWDCRHHTSNSSASNGPSSEEHAKVDACCLNAYSDGYDSAAQHHESDTTKLVTDESLDKGTHCLACNVYCNHSTRKTLGRMAHVTDPAFVSDGRCRNTCVEAEEECAYRGEKGNAQCKPIWSHDGRLGWSCRTLLILMSNCSQDGPAINVHFEGLGDSHLGATGLQQERIECSERWRGE